MLKKGRRKPWSFAYRTCIFAEIVERDANDVSEVHNESIAVVTRSQCRIKQMERFHAAPPNSLPPCFLREFRIVSLKLWQSVRRAVGSPGTELEFAL